MSKIALSAVLITQNAEKTLPLCLASVDFCAEIIIIDSGSTDATIPIAKSAGAHVISSHWRGFGLQKQFAVEQATYDWVLCIDSDEQISDRLRESLIQVFSTSPEPSFHAYRYARRNRFMGCYLRHGEGYPDWVVRCFNRRYAHWSNDAVHETVVVIANHHRNTTGLLRGDLLHDSAESLDDYIKKQNQYSTLAANNIVIKSRYACIGSLILSPLLRFIKFYFFKLGFLDGIAGFIHIAIGCGTSFLKYAKILNNQGHKKS